jgi:hypothetical protein
VQNYSGLTSSPPCLLVSRLPDFRGENLHADYPGTVTPLVEREMFTSDGDATPASKAFRP